MAQCILKPDLQFAQELREAGGENLKKCFQCATCSVACPFAPANAPYPRKEMVWASWGLWDKLRSDTDLWLCHNCGNCSDLCPRGARPADVMAAARTVIYKELTFPSIVGKWMSRASGLPVLFLIPAVLWLVVWWIRAGYNNGNWFPRAADGRIVFGQIFYGDYTIDPIFMLTFFGACFILYCGVRKLWDMFSPQGKLLVIGKKKSWFCHLIDVLMEEVVTHRKFDDCEDGPITGKAASNRKWGHAVLVWSFAILAFVTAVVALGHWGGKIIPVIEIHTPMPLTFPVKILANIGALMLFYGLAVLTVRRVSLDSANHGSSFYDWYLLGIIWLVAATGMLSQCFRLADAVKPAFVVYYFHLVFVWMLFAYLPWSKLGHLVYRTAALVYVRMYGRS
ncbi:quinone-interacting membrane-bound oxidoreductase complex subunit QmoC [Candidatus Desulfovibrio trichonymphae]|uniref:Quinone-modifying oxidoreductase transmembrane subunit C n=1 Tax=Candidatus Desulfovibrio trichonymphae TaxID=1725232 RepID=A0A1J1DPW7_9BACT|nr:quinone-interacting membrane-bound oxidoreductase complex subunit QmoC [Candidatus Desulfovibrio trichonymphae]BAV91874.1 quinone-modifying oxidoreductase transmembrane subunit C [Candidatus Desulfovibrio trichonymphae]GHU92054.1 heterodisulfide reductase subunit E [Deltaproteobacteria bacterium]